MKITHQEHDGYEHVVTFEDTDFHCIIAIHSTHLGPAVGGCRMKSYATIDDASLDARRLAKGMTYKCSLAGLHFGGGKAVIIANHANRRDALLRFGDAVNYFKGEYVTAEDVGTTIADMDIIAEITPHLTRIDGSVNTARGVLSAMMAAALYNRQWGDTLDGVPIWVQGVGKVGMHLVTMLSGLEHPNIFVSDLNPDAVAAACAIGAHAISESDKRFIAVYAPCAMGQVINAENVATMTATIICGAANNQLADDAYADVLYKNGVLYCPDFLVNAGGVITGACEIGQSYDHKQAEDLTDDIGERTWNVLKLAEAAKVSPLTMARGIAEARF